MSDGRLSHRRIVEHRRHLVRGAFRLSAAPDRRDFVWAAGLLCDRRLRCRHCHRPVGLAARGGSGFGRRKRGWCGTAGWHPHAAAARPLLRNRNTRVCGDGADPVRAVPLPDFDRWRAGRPQWRRRVPQHPLHLRQQHRCRSVHAADPCAARCRIAGVHAARAFADRRGSSHDWRR